MDEERINGPERLDGKARFAGLAIKRGYKLVFAHTNKSGFGTADIARGLSTDHVIGCLYEINDSSLKELDKIEGVNSRAYKRVRIAVAEVGGNNQSQPRVLEAITYIVLKKEKGAKTNAEYANYILRGIVLHKIGRVYFERIRTIIIENNPNIEMELVVYPQLK
jgi:gamma-glutamylcyclotransferase (GGCT)/AIG2-like uncharacterized protein YtfP